MLLPSNVRACQVPTIMTSSLHARRAMACAENPSETVLHFCTFLLNPHFDLEPDYIAKKLIERPFRRYIVRTVILSTFHARVEYISVKTVMSGKMDLPTPCSDDVTVYLYTAHRHTKVKT